MCIYRQDQQGGGNIILYIYGRDGHALLHIQAGVVMQCYILLLYRQEW